jgi:hypothetical protein
MAARFRFGSLEYIHARARERCNCGTFCPLAQAQVSKVRVSVPTIDGRLPLQLFNRTNNAVNLLADAVGALLHNFESSSLLGPQAGV